MGRSEIRARISSLQGKIHEYENNIVELSAKKQIINTEYITLENNSKIPMLHYDLTNSSKWCGNNYREAERYREKSIIISEKEKSAVNNLVSDVDFAIQRLRDMINSCRAEISYLESLLASIED